MDYFVHAQKVFEIEQAAISRLSNNLKGTFNAACELLRQCTGKIVVLGMGKSGHIGNKIAATLASTGSPAFAINAAEASHGDLGMISQGDMILAISHSGTTPELLNLLPLIKRLEIPMIAITGNVHSALAQAANVHLWVEIEKEACPLNLAPTASTTATLALGDAIAVALLTVRGFTKENFAFSHPGGALGKRLILTVRDLMKSGQAIPSVSPQASMRETLVEMTAKKLGMTTVADENQKLLGIFTDGDLRRFFEKGLDIHETLIQAVMVKEPITIFDNVLAIEAFEIMEAHKITSLVVVNQQQKIAGVIHLHDILSSGIV